MIFFLFLCSGAAFGQSFQNPYFVMEGNPSALFQNSTPSSFPNLPFTVPGFGLVPYSQRIHTAVNGVFDECGDPLFYVAGDWVFDENGMVVGELQKKDFFEKTNSVYGNPAYTENFEAVICEVPDSPGEYFIFCSDYDISFTPTRTFIYVYQYDAIGKMLDPTPSGFGAGANILEGSSSRFALSKKDQAGGRIFYVLGETGLLKIEIPHTVQSHYNLSAEPVYFYSTGEAKKAFPELELNHDGTKLAWATQHPLPDQEFYSVIHFYDLTNSQHSTFQPFSQAIEAVSGLEFLPDGRLAASMVWNDPYQNFNGIGYFNAALTGFNLINNSASYSVGMIELGISNSSLWSLYGIDHNRVVRIPFSGSGTPVITNTITYHTGLISPNFLYNSGALIKAVALPDQVDGESYPFSTDCGAGNGGGDGRDSPESGIPLSTEQPDPSITFSPIITITNHE